MKRPLVVRPQADVDLLGHCLYLAREQSGRGWKLREATQECYEQIERHARSGATFNLPGFSDLELRF